MKRIVDGLTYNTDTSTLLARAESTVDDQWSPHNGAECEWELYATRGGAYFLVTTIHTKDAEGEPRDKAEFDPMTVERAQAWLLEGDVEVYCNPFQDPPEAAAESEAGATIYIRVPAALKRDVDEAARAAKVSGNVWAMRCVERCLRPNPEVERKLGIAYHAVRMVIATGGEGLSSAQEGDLLDETLELIAGAWRELGFDSGIEDAALKHGVEELRRRYPLHQNAGGS